MPTGYLIEQGPQGVVQERDTATCGHCQHVMILPPSPGGVISRVAPPCHGCGKFICQVCKDKGGCDPWEEKMRRSEARFRLRKSLALD